MNQYEPDEILNSAIMTKTPHVIVEGIDDIRVYEGLASLSEVRCEVYPSEMIEGMSGGSEGVIRTMKIIEALPMPSGKLCSQFVMGVIDRDVRFYRGEMPTISSVFSLDMYSIESHFVSKHVIRPVVERFTRVLVATELDVDQIYSEVEARVSDLYYFSLDALKKSLDPDYASVVGFSSDVGRRKNINTIMELQRRKSDLDEFAAGFQLSPCIDSMRRFVKGKWLLAAFAEELFKEIERLVGRCKRSEIIKCRSCYVNNSAPCLFQLRNGFNKDALYSVVLDFLGVPDLFYVREALKYLEHSAAA